MMFNPILPIEYFIPDVEARVYDDGRIYLYGSMDIRGSKYYCSKEYHVFSSSDLKNWIDHGVSFSVEKDVSWSDGYLYAPDCICKDEKYYLYFCMSDGSEGVAVSDTPYGPFTDATIIEGAEGIDPAIFIDDDGQAYYYWGQFNKVRCAKMNSDMRTLDLSSVCQPLSVEEHNFHEGFSIRKFGDIYYALYTDTGRHGGGANCLAYATSIKPMGPFTYRGIVIDNYKSDPKVWNNHGSLAKYNDKYYVFYHRSSRNGKFSRRVCAEEIFIDKSGLISEVVMTSQGFGSNLLQNIIIPSYTACEMQGSVYIAGLDEFGLENDKEEIVGNIIKESSICYRYIHFDNPKSLVLDIFVKGEGELTVFQHSSDGNIIAKCKLDDTNFKFELLSVEITGAISSKQSLWLVFKMKEESRAYLKSLKVLA